MCNRVALPEENELRDLVKNQHITVQDYDHYYHAFAYTHPQVPILTMEEPTVIKTSMWGLAPHWARDKAEAQSWVKQIVNAKCEKVTSTYKPYIGAKRCLVFVKGFYEFRWEDEKGKVKTPYFIYATDQKPFTFGGIYNNWMDQSTGEVFKTFTILTTPANELMSHIHNSARRMPLIVGTDQWSEWLDSGIEPSAFLRPYQDGFLKAHPINKNLAKPSFNANVPEIQLEYKDSLF
jgi:putative SOS response-associated peptidase YedK